MTPPGDIEGTDGLSEYLSGAEAHRLAELIDLRVTPAPEADLDHIVQLASDQFDMPIALINLAYADHFRVKARVGVDVESVPREQAFCSHTIDAEDMLVISDLSADDRFSSNPLVTGEFHARFYAGAPLRTKSGARIGALCVLDKQPRPGLTGAQQRLLRHLATLVTDKLELRRLQQHESIALRFFDATAEAFVCLDGQGLITHWNPGAEMIFGYTGAQAVGQSIDLIIPARFRGAHATDMARLAKGATSQLAGRRLDILAIRRNGEEFPIEFMLSVWQDGNQQRMGAIMRDMSLSKKNERELEYLNNHDQLTGLPNRYRFCQHAEAALASGRPIAIMLVDVEGFETLTDKLGHEGSDLLLPSLALRLASGLSSSIQLARLRGDQFAVLLEGEADVAAAGSLAEVVQTVMAEPLSIGNRHVSINVHIGIASSELGGQTVALLLSAADIALGTAKSRGGFKPVFFEEPMRDRIIAGDTLLAELRRAHDTNQFVLHYQPQVDLATGRLIGCEALIRWDHPDRGTVMPGQFIRTLENADFCEEVGWWTLEEACRQLAAWDAAGLHVPCIGVNLFACQLRAPDFVDRVTLVLQAHGLTTDRLELEITESIALDRVSVALQRLEQVRELGVGLAFDDFGTGFASLSTLKRIPLTRLKIDRSFITELHRDGRDAAIVRAVVGIGQGLSISVIAEGIEELHQAERLRQMGCHEGQGFLYGRGMQADNFLAKFGSQVALA